MQWICSPVPKFLWLFLSVYECGCVVCLYVYIFFCHIWSGKRVGVFVGMCFNLCVYILMRLYINARRVCAFVCVYVFNKVFCELMLAAMATFVFGWEAINWCIEKKYYIKIMCQNIFHRYLKYKRCGARETDDDYQINTVKKTERCGPCCMRDGRMYVSTDRHLK